MAHGELFIDDIYLCLLCSWSLSIPCLYCLTCTWLLGYGWPSHNGHCLSVAFPVHPLWAQFHLHTIFVFQLRVLHPQPWMIQYHSILGLSCSAAGSWVYLVWILYINHTHTGYFCLCCILSYGPTLICVNHNHSASLYPLESNLETGPSLIPPYGEPSSLCGTRVMPTACPHFLGNSALPASLLQVFFSKCGSSLSMSTAPGVFPKACFSQAQSQLHPTM